MSKPYKRSSRSQDVLKEKCDNKISLKTPNDLCLRHVKTKADDKVGCLKYEKGNLISADAQISDSLLKYMPYVCTLKDGVNIFFNFRP